MYVYVYVSTGGFTSSSGFQYLYFCFPHWHLFRKTAGQPVSSIWKGDITNYKDYKVTNYKVTDYNVTDYNFTDNIVTDYNVTDYNFTDNIVTDYNVTDYKVTDYKVTDNIVTDYKVTDHQETNYKVTNYKVLCQGPSSPLGEKLTLLMKKPFAFYQVCIQLARST
jgi:hypothetical protein